MRLAKINKYRNAIATAASRELWYSELALDTSTAVGTTGIAVDSKHLYVKSANGTSLQALNISNPGKTGFQAPCLLNASSNIIDWNTALYDECLVVAGDSQGVVTVWKDHSESIRLQAHPASCRSAQFLPTVPGLLVSAADKEVKIWNADAVSKRAIWEATSASTINSVAIKGDGQLLAASTNDGTFAIYDPRQGSASHGVATGSSTTFHTPGRPTHALWLGEKPFLITTGMTKMRERSAALWDQRNPLRPLASLTLQQSTKPLIPLLDEDTSLVYLAEKGDCTIRWADADPSSSAPLTELGSVVLGQQISGCALLPKHQLDVMSGEIARLYAVVGSCGTGVGGAVVPISHVAPRRTYLDFHSDLFPDTRAPVPAQTCDQWMAHEAVCVPRISLDPSKMMDSLRELQKACSATGSQDSIVGDSAKKEGSLDKTNFLMSKQQQPGQSQIADGSASRTSCTDSEPEQDAESANSSGLASTQPNVRLNKSVSEPRQKVVASQKPPQTPSKRVWKLDQEPRGKFRYLEGVIYKPSEHFANIHDVDQRFSQENDPIKASPEFIAFACAGTGGKVAVLRRDSPGRVPENPAMIVHGAGIVAMEFDPFDSAVIATAGIDNKLQLWRIPDAPLNDESFFELEEYIHVTADRIHQIRFHPWVQGIVSILVSDGGAQAIYVYNGLMMLFAIGKTEEGIHSFAWSPDGERIALTTKKSKQVRVYDAHTQELLGTGEGMESVRPSRLVWVDNSYVCLSGFGSGSKRQIAIYSVDSLAKPIAKKTIDVGPGLLVPFADPDTNIIFLDDRGSRLTHAFEIVGSDLIELPKLVAVQPSLGMAVLPKRYANIAKCELLRAYRLNANSIESIGFRVPRKRPDYFQDDIYPCTLDWGTPAIDAALWIDGVAATPNRIDLCPQGMKPLSQAPSEPIPTRTPNMQSEVKEDNTKDTIKAMLGRVDISDNDDGDNSDTRNDGSDSDWGSE
ncbi:hypothetical protein H4217_005255 [Coemansia sp. RSA 1939]|nr:hypothetical protein H4217_005255 [Coemansia sp. RSA 1939]KAJ2611113.1 hypothetical protein EV177_003649 [Coemansia sp. RSA 1804]